MLEFAVGGWFLLRRGREDVWDCFLSGLAVLESLIDFHQQLFRTVLVFAGRYLEILFLASRHFESRIL